MRQNTLKVLSLFACSTFLTGCTKELVLLHPEGKISEGLSYLMMLSIYVMLLVVIPTIVMSILFAWKYRKGNKDADYRPNWAHSSTIEMVVWGIPIIIIIVLAIVAYRGSFEYDPYKSLSKDKKDDLIIQVIAEQFKWVFIYPEQQIATINEVRFPEKTNISFRITSDFTMSSFFIPKLAGQIYAMAGMQTQLHMYANNISDEEGYRGFSANITGFGNAQMRFRAYSLSKNDFDNWVKTIKSGQGHTISVDDGLGQKTTAIQKDTLDMTELKAIRDGNLSHHQIEMAIAYAKRQGDEVAIRKAEAEKPYPTRPSPVTYYSSVDPHLFNKIIDSYSSNFANEHHKKGH